MKWWDAHAHWTDSRLDLCRDQWIEKAFTAGLQFSLMGGVNPSDWEKQKSLKKNYPDHFGLCFGLHPEWVSGLSNEELEMQLEELSQQMHLALAVGETGLDLRPPFESSFEIQMEAFEAQLNLSQISNKPVVLHIVRAFDEAIRTFEFCEVPNRGGLVHSFNGSWPEAQKYLNLGFHISVGGTLLKSKNDRLKEVVRHVPHDRLLIETDLPDQSWGEFQGHLNPPESALAVARLVSEIRKVSLDEVLQLNITNLKTLLWKIK